MASSSAQKIDSENSLSMKSSFTESAQCDNYLLGAQASRLNCSSHGGSIDYSAAVQSQTDGRLVHICISSGEDDYGDQPIADDMREIAVHTIRHSKINNEKPAILFAGARIDKKDTTSR